MKAEALKQYGDQLAGKIGELEKEIYEEAGETFNINSPKQLGVVLFENMKLPGGRRQRQVIPLLQMCWKSCTGISGCSKDSGIQTVYKTKIHICRRTGELY